MAQTAAHRVITRHLRGQASLQVDEADSGAVTLIQHFGSAANLNIHLHCLVLEGVYQRGTDGAPVFTEVPAPSDEALRAVLHRIITRTTQAAHPPGGVGTRVSQDCGIAVEMALATPSRPQRHERVRLNAYLDIQQLRALIENATADVSTLLQGLALVPLRPGALAALTVGSLDKRLGVLLVGMDKGGSDRKIKLPPTTSEFFLAHAIGKPPDAPLLDLRAEHAAAALATLAL